MLRASPAETTLGPGFLRASPAETTLGPGFRDSGRNPYTIPSCLAASSFMISSAPPPMESTLVSR